MLQNATLRRVDPPPPAPAGPALSVRCALATPTTRDLQWLAMAGIDASAVLYLSTAAGEQVGRWAVGGRVTVELDGCPAAAWRAVHVTTRAGDVLRYVQVFLIDDPV